MATLIDKQTLIQELLTDYAKTGRDDGTQLIFDTVRHHYQINQAGWRDGRHREYGVIVHVDIIDGKFWIQWDGTEPGIADKLVEQGVPKSEIVLAFQMPFKRQFTEFAVG